MILIHIQKEEKNFQIYAINLKNKIIGLKLLVNFHQIFKKRRKENLLM